MEKVLIVVNGGLVQSIYAEPDADLDIEVLDMDNLETEGKDSDEIFEKKAEYLEAIY